MWIAKVISDNRAQFFETKFITKNIKNTQSEEIQKNALPTAEQFKHKTPAVEPYRSHKSLCKM